MDVRKEFEDKKAIYTGHFVGVSGKHLAGYFNIDPIMPHSSFIDKLTEMMVKPYEDQNIDTVVVPATGAIPFAHLGALHLQRRTDREIKAVWADKIKVDGQKDFAFERSTFEDYVKGKKILILEDMINQMFTIKKVIELVRRTGGEIVGVASVASNSGVSAESLEIPRYDRLCLIEYQAWTPEECAKNGLCAQKQPIVEDIGHGGDLKKEHPDYPGGFVRLLGH
jgi:orotate phosphoribosyltransferase